MSEDSIASESLCHRTESSASLPPRKRLLAGFRQNGWYSDSSSSCPAQTEEIQVKATNPNEPGLEKNDESSVENGDLGGGGSEGASHCVDESIGTDKSKRHRTYSSTKSKRLKKSMTGDPDSFHQDKDLRESPFSGAEIGENLEDTVVAEIKTESEFVSQPPVESVERDSSVPLRESDSMEEESVVPKRNPRNKSKDATTYTESGKSKRNSGGRVKKEDNPETLKPRRNPARQHPAKSKEVVSKKPASEEDRSQIARVLSDEEFARHLHRIINSSPRISRCMNYKENGPLLSLNR